MSPLAVVISYDKNNKLRAKYSSKSYIVKTSVDKRYFINIDGKKMDVTKHASLFLMKQKGGNISTGLTCLSPDLIQKISEGLSLESFQNFIQASKTIRESMTVLENQIKSAGLEKQYNDMKNQMDTAFRNIFTSGQGGEESYNALEKEVKNFISVLTISELLKKC